jgi:hypothetical protein
MTTAHKVTPRTASRSVEESVQFATAGVVSPAARSPKPTKLRPDECLPE